MSLWQSAQVSRTNDSRPSLARDTRNLTQRQAVKYLCHHHHHDLSSRSQLLIEAFEILNIYFASTFATRPCQALTI